MAQPLRAPSVSVTPIDRYREPKGLESKPLLDIQRLTQSEVQPHSDAPKQNRKRGMLLSQQGWQKLVQANVLHDKFGKRYIHEQLSDRSLLDVRTVSRILGCEVKVDKSTLRTFFRAFNLQLDMNDYTVPGEAVAKQNLDAGMNYATVQTIDTLPILTPLAPELMPLVEELLQLRQRMMDDYDRFFDRLGLDRLGSLQQ